MPLLSDKLYAELTQAELMALVLELTETVKRLEAEVRTWREELERYQKPPTSSRNSSQPPARDWKADRTQRKRRKRVGAKAGHAKAGRPLVDNPDKVIERWVETCAHCGAGLLGQAAERVIRRQVTELPEIKPVVIETRPYEVQCPGCHRVQRGTLPEGLDASRQFGPRLEALVTYFHHDPHMGFERLRGVLRNVFGLSLSEGGAVAIVERAGQAAQPAAEAIGERVRQSAVIASDETSARVHGRNYWEWVFIGNGGEYHLIRRSRGQDVIDEFMAEYRAEVWLSDCWKPQLKAPADRHQLCLAHTCPTPPGAGQVRALQGLLDQRPRLRWAYEMQALFRAAMRLGKRREALTVWGYARQVTIVERRLDRLLARPVRGVGANLLHRYRTHRKSLLVFLQRPEVPSDNNACERALRPSVIHRKVMGSFRSDWGARA